MSTKNELNYNLSFEAKLILAGEPTILKYQEIKELLKKVVGVKSKISWDNEVFSNKTLDIVTLDFDKDQLKAKVITGEIVEELVLKTKTNQTKVLKLIQEALNQQGLTKTKKVEDFDYLAYYKEKTMEELLQCGLVKDDAANAVKKAPKPKSTSSKIDNTTVGVKFIVKTINCDSVDMLYLVGNIEELGNWNPKKAIKLNKIASNQFEKMIQLPISSKIEFKVSKSKTWCGVEKGIFKEEIKNHAYMITKEIQIENKIYNFREE